ncbi:hypothetical protein KCU92_g60, partial [Aureobasidium melanogenum]
MLIQRALALLHLPLLEQHDPFETAAPTDLIDVHSLEMFVEPSPPKPRQSLSPPLGRSVQASKHCQQNEERFWAADDSTRSFAKAYPRTRQAVARSKHLSQHEYFQSVEQDHLTFRSKQARSHIFEKTSCVWDRSRRITRVERA